MSRLVSDINFFKNETIVKLDDGEELTLSTNYPDGARMTLDEFKNIFFDIEHREIYVNEILDND